MGYYDKDNCLYIIDRIKDLMKYQSWHVVPAILEGILLTHPKIQEAVVFGLPHHVDGDHPTAVVVLAPNSGNVTPEEIVEFMAERVHDREKLRG